MTDAELTILSLIAEGPRYGHEVQRAIDERGLREWVTVGFSSVYYILNRLEAQNLLQGELQSSGRTPSRKVYSITESGRGVLQTAISELLRQPRSLGAGFELGLANLFVLKPVQVYRVMSQHRSELAQRLDAVEASWARQQAEGGSPVHIVALFTHSIALMRAELTWMDDFLTEWKQHYPAVIKDETLPARHEAAGNATHHHVVTTPPDKMIQRLKRLPPTEPEE